MKKVDFQVIEKIFSHEGTIGSREAKDRLVCLYCAPQGAAEPFPRKSAGLHLEISRLYGRRQDRNSLYRAQ